MIKEKRCPICGKHFIPNGIQKHCSPKCHYKSLGKKAYKVISKIARKPLIKKVKSIPEFTKNSKELREEQVENFSYTFCQLCKKPGAVECHHIIYRSEKPGHIKLHSKINLILLCKTHHDWIHENKQNRKQLVFDRKLNEIFGEDVIH
jgi:5-methylcytosine-specific restriction endonuclease McrA